MNVSESGSSVSLKISTVGFLGESVFTQPLRLVWSLVRRSRHIAFPASRFVSRRRNSPEPNAFRRHANAPKDCRRSNSAIDLPQAVLGLVRRLTARSHHRPSFQEFRHGDTRRPERPSPALQ